MIDFKQILENNPRFSQFDMVKKLIDEVELDLKYQIEKNPDRDFWQHNHKSKDMFSNKALYEMYSYILKEYVETNKTQMIVSFEKEIDNGMHYFPAQIVFMISRDKSI